MKASTLSPFPSRFRKAVGGAALAFLAATATGSSATTLLTIDDLVRPGGTSPNTFVTGTSFATPTTAAVSSGPATLDFVSKTGTLVTYFDSYSLDEVGKSLTFEFTATFSNFNNASAGFRVGLFNTATATPMTADVDTGGSFVKYTGYGLLSRGAASANDGQLFRRDPAQTNILSPSNGTIFSSTVNSLGAVNGTSQSGSFTLERTALDTITLTWQFGAQTALVVTDVGANILTTFNTIGFYFNNSISPAVGSEMNFTKFNVTAVPEPSYALLVVGLLAGAAWKRRRR